MKTLFSLVLCVMLTVTAQAQTALKPPAESVLDRFLRYVKIDTQSQEDQTTTPSTRKQLNLANLLAKELTALGAQNVRVSEFGIVYATVPGNLPDNSKAPVVGFIAHMDTSPAVSGENVNAIIHKNYQGGDIVLPKDPAQIISVEKNPVLKELKAFLKPIRGGTDGARLTFRGLPTPNLFTGGSNFHGKLEFNSRRGLEKSTETLLHLVQIFAEKS